VLSLCQERGCRGIVESGAAGPVHTHAGKLFPVVPFASPSNIWTRSDRHSFDSTSSLPAAPGLS
jgi:hypothetical protein